jgi:transposase
MLRLSWVSESLPTPTKPEGGDIVYPLYVGIDVSSKNNVVYLMKPDGSKHSTFSVQNNLGGAKLLSEKVVSALTTLQINDVVIGMEATSVYGDNLMCFLREDGNLGQYNRKLHMLNPKQVKKVQGSILRPAEE